MKRLFLPILFVICMLTQLSAQELNFSVTINTAQVSGTDQRVYEALKESMLTFMNQRIWTNCYLCLRKPKDSLHPVSSSAKPSNMPRW